MENAELSMRHALLKTHHDDSSAGGGLMQKNASSPQLPYVLSSAVCLHAYHYSRSSRSSPAESVYGALIGS